MLGLGFGTYYDHCALFKKDCRMCGLLPLPPTYARDLCYTDAALNKAEHAVQSYAAGKG